MGTRGRMEYRGSADIRTITHQQALKSLEETLIATKLTRIEFPRKVRHRQMTDLDLAIQADDLIHGEPQRKSQQGRAAIAPGHDMRDLSYILSIC